MKSYSVADLFVDMNSGDRFYDAVDAYNSGDFNTALHIFRELAQAGDQEAQYNLSRMIEAGQGHTDDQDRLRLLSEASPGESIKDAFWSYVNRLGWLKNKYPASVLPTRAHS